MLPSLAWPELNGEAGSRLPSASAQNTQRLFLDVYRTFIFIFIFVISGIPRVIQCKFRLPLKLICLPGQPSKTASHKLTIDTNKPPVSLPGLFPGGTWDALCRELGNVGVSGILQQQVIEVLSVPVGWGPSPLMSCLGVSTLVSEVIRYTFYILSIFL